MSIADGIAWENEFGWNTDVPKKVYGETVEEFIEWINKAEIAEVEVLLKRYGFEF
ncbi:hypothetical protein ACFVSK_21180 [Cellulosimicrobium cellulans]|uniref:hypothetical protein n=1 Tax=Cellulosimicrobium cellulans TaxID=1710 RepID=UPI0036E36D8B